MKLQFRKCVECLFVFVLCGDSCSLFCTWPLWNSSVSTSVNANPVIEWVSKWRRLCELPVPVHKQCCCMISQPVRMLSSSLCPSGCGRLWPWLELRLALSVHVTCSAGCLLPGDTIYRLGNMANFTDWPDYLQLLATEIRWSDFLPTVFSILFLGSNLACFHSLDVPYLPADTKQEPMH